MRKNDITIIGYLNPEYRMTLTNSFLLDERYDLNDSAGIDFRCNQRYSQSNAQFIEILKKKKLIHHCIQ